MPAGAAIVATVSAKGEDRWLSVLGRGASTDVRLWQGDLDSAHLRELLTGLPTKLEGIHYRSRGHLDLAPESSKQAVDELYGVALDVGYALFRSLPSELHAWTARSAPGALDPSVEPRVVEVSIPHDFFFPFELLQWQDLPLAETDPKRRVRALMGMSAMITRRHNDMPGDAGAPRLGDGGKLPVSVLRHGSLTAAKQEVIYLQEVEPLVELYGPWPKQGGLAELVAVRHLLDSTAGLDGVPRAQPVAVLHLACHCGAKGMPDDHYLAVGRGAHEKITLQQLRRGVMAKLGLNAHLPRPFVFLNACASGSPQVGDRSSFATFFLEQQFLGVLGTLCDISDDVAAHYAAVFYEHLLRGRTVGEAMHEARWHLMDVHRNPFGLLYTFHGNPDLRLARSHAGQVVPACRP